MVEFDLAASELGFLLVAVSSKGVCVISFADRRLGSYRWGLANKKARFKKSVSTFN